MNKFLLLNKMNIKWLLIYSILAFGIVFIFANPPLTDAGHTCPTTNGYCEGARTCSDTCNPYGHSCSEVCGSCGAAPCSSGGGSSGGDGPYNCGPAASCESLGKTGYQGDIICSNSCGSANNNCWTSGRCNDSTGCTADSQCPSNISCPVSNCGLVKCNTSNGACYSDCTGCGISGSCNYGSCGGNGCSSNQRYISGSGNNCPSGYTGAGCYADSSCGTSSSNPTPASAPKGFHDSSSCTESNGWACDPNNYTQPLQIHFYKDGQYGAGGTFIGSTLANLQREQGVGDQCGGNRNHGFSFVTPNSLKDSQSHSIYAYAISAVGAGNPLLTSTPKTITCSCPTVGSTSTLSPSGSIPAGTHSLTWTDVTNATIYNVRVDDLINSWDCTANPTDLCSDNVASGSVSYNFQAGRSYSFWIDAYNSCGSVSYIDTTVTVTPNCNATPVCSGTCNAADNICPSSSGTRSGCVYTTYSGGGSCTQTTTPDQPCTKTYTCPSGNICVSGRCLTNYEPWIQTTGGDVHSNTGINTPGGP